MLRSNHPPFLLVVPARGRTTCWARAGAVVSWGAGGCQPLTYSRYISALWGLCNPGLSVRSAEALPEQDLLGIWGPVLLA